MDEWCAGGDGHDVVLRHRGLDRAAEPAGRRLPGRAGRPPRDPARGLDGARRHRDGHRGGQLLRRVPDGWRGGGGGRRRRSAGWRSTTWPGGERLRVRIGIHTGTPRRARRRLLGDGRPPGRPDRRLPPTAARWWSRRSPRTWPARSCRDGVALRRPRHPPPQGHPGTASTSTSSRSTGCRRTSRRCAPSARRRACPHPATPLVGTQTASSRADRPARLRRTSGW